MRKFILGLLLIVALLVTVVLFRTFTYGGPAIASSAIDLPEVPTFDVDRAATNIGEAIQFKTITVTSGDPREGQEGPWLDMQAWMETAYPQFHAASLKETVPGGYTLLFTWQGSNEELDPLLLMAHQDVVPVNLGTISDWAAPPFDGQVKDGFVFGRGALDDKASMIALLESLETLVASGFKPRRTIHLMLGHDEEVSGSGAEAGIALLKSRGVTPVMALDEGSLALNRSPLTGKPMAFIGVAEKGYLTLQLSVSAEGGHSSRPPRDSAAVRLSRAIVALDDKQMPAHISKPPVSELFASSAPDLSFVNKMAFANLWLFGSMVEGQMDAQPTSNAMIRTTTAPTMLAGSAKENVLAQRAVAWVNFRVHPQDSVEKVIQHVKKVTEGIEGLTISQVENSGIRGGNASPVSPIDGLPYQVLAAVGSDVVDGRPAVPALVIAATDARYASAITPNVYRFMPIVLSSDDLTGIHGTDEKISVENVERLVRGYSQIILAMDENTKD